MATATPTALEFFHALYPAGTTGFVEFRSIAPDGGPANQRFVPLPLQRLPKFSERRHQYFGICPRVREGGTAEDVEIATALWADVDYKAFPGGETEGLAALLKGAGPRPSIIVGTGHGLHAYWLLSETLPVKEALLAVEALRRTINPEMDKVSDAPRILRVPGTFNVKQDPPLLVGIVYWKPEERLDAAALEELGVAAPTEPRVPERVRPAESPADDLAAWDVQPGLAGASTGEQRDTPLPAQKNAQPAGRAATEDAPTGKVDPLVNCLRLGVPRGGTGTPFDGRNDFLMLWAARQYGRGLGPEEVMLDLLGKNLQACKPPLAEDEVRRTAGSMWKKERVERLKHGELPPEGADEDTEQEREDVLQVLAERLGIRFDDIERIGGAEPFYRLHCGDRVAEVPAEKILSQTVCRNRIAAAVERIPNRIGAKARPGWDFFAGLIVKGARHVDAAEESTVSGELRAWLSGYVERYRPVLEGKEEGEEESHDASDPRIRDGALLIHVLSLRKFVEDDFGTKTNHKAVCQRLRAEGFTGSERVSIRLPDGKVTSRMLWRVPTPRLPDAPWLTARLAGQTT